MTNGSNNLGSVIKQRRIMGGLTLSKLSIMSGVSASELCRIERGERFPSARILWKITRPLGFGEGGLSALAGYLSPQPSSTVESPNSRRLDPYVAQWLSQESLEIQRTVLAILIMLKNIAKL